MQIIQGIQKLWLKEWLGIGGSLKLKITKISSMLKDVSALSSFYHNFGPRTDKKKIRSVL